MKYNYRKSAAVMGTTALVLLLSGFKGISHSSLTTPYRVYSELSSSPYEAAWLSLPVPPPPVDKETGGSRDGLLCLLTPGSSGEDEVAMWNNSPQFVWAEKFLESNIQGRVNQVVVVLPDSQTVVWSQSVVAGEQLPFPTTSPWSLRQLPFAGEALEPGQTYEWYLLDNHNRPLESGSFKVMPQTQQHAITADLIAIEEALTREGATTEAIAAAKAHYFAEQQMWPDALQIVFAMENPSDVLVEFQSRIPSQQC